MPRNTVVRTSMTAIADAQVCGSTYIEYDRPADQNPRSSAYLVNRRISTRLINNPPASCGGVSNAFDLPIGRFLPAVTYSEGAQRV